MVNVISSDAEGERRGNKEAIRDARVIAVKGPRRRVPALWPFLTIMFCFVWPGAGAHHEHWTDRLDNSLPKMNWLGSIQVAGRNGRLNPRHITVKCKYKGSYKEQ